MGVIFSILRIQATSMQTDVLPSNLNSLNSKLNYIICLRLHRLGMHKCIMASTRGPIVSSLSCRAVAPCLGLSVILYILATTSPKCTKSRSSPNKPKQATSQVTCSTKLGSADAYGSCAAVCHDTTNNSNAALLLLLDSASIR